MNLLKIHKSKEKVKSFAQLASIRLHLPNNQLFVLTRPSELALFKRKPRCSLTTELKPSGFIYSSAVANQL